MSELDIVLTAIADQTRRAMLQRLTHGPATTGQLADLFPVSRPAISRHVRALQDAGLVETKVRGRHRWHQLVVRPLDPIGAWLSDLEARHAVAPRLQPEEDP